MAVGDRGNTNNNNGSNGNKLFENTYYSRLRFKSKDAPLSLGFSFRSGLLIMEISELKDGFKYEPLEGIYLSPTKAGLFAKEIEKFREYLNQGDIIPGKAFGVNAGMAEKISYVGIHANENKDIMLTIGKFDGEGNILEQATFTFNKEYHFALEWENIETMDVAKSYNDMVEIDQLYYIMKDFARSMNGVIGYSVADIARFDQARILKKMDPIFDKLGIERYSGNGSSYSGNRSNNFLDNTGSTQSEHTSFDNIEGLME